MSEEVTMQFEDITKALEDSYNELHSVIKQIGKLNGVISSIKSSSDTIRKEYSEILDNNRLKDTEVEYKETVNKMEDSLKRLHEGIINIQTIRRIADENISVVTDKMKRLESLLDKFNDRSSKLDKKLTKSIETLKFNQNNVENNAKKALKMIELNYQIDKYEEIITLQKENNELLKSLKKHYEIKPTQNKPRKKYSSHVKKMSEDV